MLSQIPINLEKVGKDLDKEILRAGIIAELDAINLYEQMAVMTKNELIKKMLLEGQSQSSIARMFQVSTTLINSIANGKLWRHVVVIKGDY